MIDIKQFRDHVVDPTLEQLGLYSIAASELVLGTALQESKLTYLVQLGGGPALGVCQMEEATHDDIWRSFLAYRERLRLELQTMGRSAIELTWNLRYSVAMCRVHYRRVRHPLPEAGDLEGQAHYWKQHYNTELGKGTVEEYCRSWQATRGVL